MNEQMMEKQNVDAVNLAFCRGFIEGMRLIVDKGIMTREGFGTTLELSKETRDEVLAEMEKHKFIEFGPRGEVTALLTQLDLEDFL